MKTKQLFSIMLVALFLFSASRFAFASVPAMPSPIYMYGGAAKVCPGETRYYYVTYVAGVSYTWTAPTGMNITGGQGTDSIMVSITSAFISTGTLSVYATNSSGNSTPRTLSVARNNPGTPGYVTGTLTAACAGTVQVYTVPAVAGVNYSWSSDVGTMTLAPSSTNNVTATLSGSFSSGNLMVNGYNGCGTSGTRTQAIMSVPAKPGMITGNTYGVCGSTGTYYSVAAVPNATSYTWTATGGATLSPTTLNNDYAQFPNPGFSTGNINVVSNNACGSSAARSLTVYAKPQTPTSVSGNAMVCNGSVELYCANGSYGATTYTWTVPSGWTILGSSSGACIQVSVGASGGSVKAKANNSCGSSGTRSFTVAVTCRNAGDALIDNTFSVFPNPATDNVTISSTGLADGNYTVVLTNLLGQVISTHEVISADNMFEARFDLSNLSSGLYMVSVQSATMKKTFKIEKN